MSVSIATFGMFNGCIGRTVGGTPPYALEQDIVVPSVLIKHVEIKTISTKIYEQIKVKLLDDGGSKC